MTRSEMVAKIEQMWKNESDIMLEIASEINRIEKEGFERVKPLMDEREELERKAFDGSTRIELIKSTGKDPLTGKTTIQMMQDVLSSMGEHLSGN
jgi:hypothetical protein